MPSQSEQQAITLKQLIAEQNSLLKEQLRIENDRLKTSKNNLVDQQDVANVIKSQLKTFKEQLAEKSAIQRSTNSISKIQESLSVLDRKELTNTKAVNKLKSDQLKISKDIRLLEITKKKVLDDSKGLTQGQIEDAVILAGSIDDQIAKATKLNIELRQTEALSSQIGDNFGSNTFNFLEDLTSKIPGLSALSKPFSTAADAARDMASGIESAVMSGGDGLTGDRLKELGLDKVTKSKTKVDKEGNAKQLTGTAAANVIKGLSPAEKSMLSLKAGFKSLGPIISKAFGPAVLLAKLFSALVESDKAASEMAKSMNMTYTEARNLRSELGTAATYSNNMFVTTKGMDESFIKAGKALGTNAKLSQELLTQFTELREMSGFTNEELVGIKTITDATGKSLNDVTSEYMVQAKMSSLALGIKLNEKDLAKDIGKISAATTLSLGKQPSIIADAAATARSLGMELSKVDGIASSLLDFESSIENELQAELLLGKDINLEKARQAALNNDLATVAKEISKQAGSAAEFGEMNRIQQEALAKSVGMSREDLAQTLFVQEQLVGATGKQAEEEEEIINKRIAAVGLEQTQKELREGTLDDLKNQVGMADKFSATMQKVQDLFVQLAEPILMITDLLSPVFSVITAITTGIGIIVDGFKMMAPILVPILAIMNAMWLKTQALAIISLIKGAWASLGSIPFAGPALAISAIAGGISYIKAQKAGDVDSSADGKTRISTKEGGLFELSPNDDLVAAPGASEALKNAAKGGGNTTTIVQQAPTPTSTTPETNKQADKTNSLLEEILNFQVKQPQLSSVGLYEVQ